MVVHMDPALKHPRFAACRHVDQRKLPQPGPAGPRRLRCVRLVRLVLRLPGNVSPLVHVVEPWVRLDAGPDGAIELPQHVAAKIVVAVVHVAAAQRPIEGGASTTVALAVVQAPDVRGIGVEGPEEVVLVHKVLQRLEGVPHYPGVHALVALAVEEQHGHLVQVGWVVDQVLGVSPPRPADGLLDVDIPVIAPVLLIFLHATAIRGACCYQRAIHAR
mmetsp:Transcript_32266/g.77039  ORF Transcript_32266/g.77039 Transcript_32266/m.77039 type:complete len:217 (-) Transcript_32266:177-827(-)